MMSYFNRLPIEKQNVLRSLGPTKAAQIMSQIISKLEQQNQNIYTTITNPSTLLDNRLYTGVKDIFKVPGQNQMPIPNVDKSNDNSVVSNLTTDNSNDNNSSNGNSTSKSLKIVKI